MLTIGQVAARTGLKASAIRYYEEAGLLAKAQRRAGTRVYDAAVLDTLAAIALAKSAGFTLKEIRVLLAAARPPRTWRISAQAKRAALAAEMTRLKTMQFILSRIATCSCATFEECGRTFTAELNRRRPRPR